MCEGCVPVDSRVGGGACVEGVAVWRALPYAYDAQRHKQPHTTVRTGYVRGPEWSHWGS